MWTCGKTFTLSTRTLIIRNKHLFIISTHFQVKAKLTPCFSLFTRANICAEIVTPDGLLANFIFFQKCVEQQNAKRNGNPPTKVIKKGDLTGKKPRWKISGTATDCEQQVSHISPEMQRLWTILEKCFYQENKIFF